MTTWVGWDGGIGVLDIWEDLLAVFLQLGDQWEMKPLVLGYGQLAWAGVGWGWAVAGNGSGAHGKKVEKEKWKLGIPIQKKSSDKT